VSLNLGMTVGQASRMSPNDGKMPVSLGSRRDELGGRSILALTTSYPSHEQDWSGIFIAKLLSAMSKRGHRVRVVAPSDGVFHGTRVVHGIESRRFGYFLPRSCERLTRGGGGIPENLRKSNLAKLQVLPMMVAFLVASLRNCRGFDLLYANWLGAGIVGAVVNFLVGKPLIVSFRGDDGYLARDRIVWRVLTKWVSERAAAVAPVSSELAHILRDLGIAEEKLHMPRFGVDTEMFHPPEDRAPSPERLQVMYAGALIPKKGLHILLEALNDEKLKQVHLLIAGEGYYSGQLKSLCETVGISARARWTGSLAPPSVASEMRNSDILCLPSFTEGSPNVIKEALASGLPVVASRVGGIPDLVRHGETGYLFEAGNVRELRECIATLAANEELRIRMGRAAREFVMRSGMSWNDTAIDFETIFNRIL
jgi:glycosyltransferase involved in cell wall biosynthesis